MHCSALREHCQGGSQNTMQAREFMRRAFAIPRAFVRRARDSHWFGARLDVTPPLNFTRTSAARPPTNAGQPGGYSCTAAAPLSTRRVSAGIPTEFRRRKCGCKPFRRPPSASLDPTDIFCRPDHFLFLERLYRYRVPFGEKLTFLMIIKPSVTVEAGLVKG